MIVEYALRDSSKPMGIAQYKTSPTLSPKLRRELPTLEEFSRELPFMSLVKLRIEIERGLRDYMTAIRLPIGQPVSIGQMIRALEQHGRAPSSASKVLGALRVMNAAAHGLDIDDIAARDADTAANEFLVELTTLRKKTESET